MSIETDYLKAKQSNNLWKFVTLHGCEHFSHSTGEKIPDEVHADTELLKYAEIHQALLLAQRGNANALLMHGDGKNEYSNANGAQLNPEINYFLAYYTKMSVLNLKQTHQLFGSENMSPVKMKAILNTTPHEWEIAFILLNSELYKDKIKSGLPFKIRKKDHSDDDSELSIQHSFIYLNEKLYAMEEKIGAGAQGEVKKAVDINRNYYVAKVEAYNEKNKGELDSEVAALQELGRHIGHFERNYTGKKIIDGMKRTLLMPYVDGCTVDEYLDLPDIADIKKLKLCQNIIQALVILHAKRIIFTDIQTSNVIINPETLKVTFIDFGKAIILPINMDKMQNPFIQLWYSNVYNEHIAPEMNSNQGEVSFASDIWLLAYRIFKFVQFENLDLEPLMTKMMAPEPHNRISLEMAANILIDMENQCQEELPFHCQNHMRISI